MPQDDAMAYHTESTKRMNIYGNRSIIVAGHEELLLSTVRRRHLSWFGHVCRHEKQPKIILHGIGDGRRRREEDCINHGGQHLGMDRPVIVVAAHCSRRQKSLGDYCRECICRSGTPTTLVSWSVSCLDFSCDPAENLHMHSQ